MEGQAGEGAAAARVLVISRDAADYAERLAAEGLEIRATASAAEARQRYRGEPIVLGEPEPVAQALRDGGLAGVRWVQSTWAGLTPLLDAARRGVRVTGVRGLFGGQMAEYALGYLLAHELRVFERRAWQQDRDWRPEPSGRLAGRTLGVMGTGSIGREVARRASALGLRCIGYSRSGAVAEPFERVYGPDALPDFLGRCERLFAALPDTPETRGLLDADALGRLPPGCVLINAGRGSLLDEGALLDALRSGRLGSAVLDVFRHEPLPAAHPLWAAPRLQITAHVAALSRPAEIAGVFLRNYRTYCAGGDLAGRLDPERGY
jgi:phosphoglycerate dehydrogenase-like enzyme